MSRLKACALGSLAGVDGMRESNRGPVAAWLDLLYEWPWGAGILGAEVGIIFETGRYFQTCVARELTSPNALLRTGADQHWLVVNRRGVLIDRGRSLSAAIAVLSLEL
jgi:hypothetical protein